MPVRSSSSSDSPRRIALIKPSALGDIMHSLPVLSALRQRFPGAHIAWVVNRLYEPLLRNHADLDDALPFDRQLLRAGWLTGARAFGRFLRALRQQDFDLVIDLQGLLRTGLMSLATGARRRVGLASAREGARWFYTDIVDDRSGAEAAGGVHAVDRYWRVAELLGAGTEEKCFRLPVEEVARQWVCGQLGDCPRPWLAVGVGSRWLTKRWPPEHFAALTQRALDRFGGTAVFVGAPDELAPANQAARLVRGNVRNLTGATSLPQLAALLNAADLTLANDTGPLHLAVALGRPVVAPYTCTVVSRTGPYGQPNRAVQTTVWCQGSYLKKCSRLECMSELTPARLWPALEEVLLRWESQRLSA
jgi:lipopolysaccharide heptosyltransferase II